MSGLDEYDLEVPKYRGSSYEQALKNDLILRQPPRHQIPVENDPYPYSYDYSQKYIPPPVFQQPRIRYEHSPTQFTSTIPIRLQPNPIVHDQIILPQQVIVPQQVPQRITPPLSSYYHRTFDKVGNYETISRTKKLIPEPTQVQEQEPKEIKENVQPKQSKVPQGLYDFIVNNQQEPTIKQKPLQVPTNVVQAQSQPQNQSKAPHGLYEFISNNEQEPILKQQTLQVPTTGVQVQNQPKTQVSNEIPKTPKFEFFLKDYSESEISPINDSIANEKLKAEKEFFDLFNQ